MSTVSQSFFSETASIPVQPAERVTRFLLFGVLLALVTSSLPQTTAAQGYLYGLGRRPFSVPIPVEMGYTDASNGNLHLTIPIASLRQRGKIPLTAALVYDSHIWHQVLVSGSKTWQPDNAGALGGWRMITTADPGSASYSISSSTCTIIVNGKHVQASGINTYSGYKWTAPDGSVHPFTITLRQFFGECSGSNNGTGNAFTTDANGLQMHITNYTTISVFAPDGTQLSPTVKDTNGNFMNGPGNITDTLGRSAITTTSDSTHVYYHVLTHREPPILSPLHRKYPRLHKLSAN